MIAFAFTFPGGRYHATPWGKHVNEADVAWPPEPVRILRALIATWWRKGDQTVFGKAVLDNLIDLLAQEAPVFQLPEAVHTHIRAYMPQGGFDPTSLIFDASLKLRPQDRLIVAWPHVELSPEHQALAEHLLQRIGYLGRAESWAQAALCQEWDGVPNAAPRELGAQAPRDRSPVDSVLARTPADWEAERARQLVLATSLKGAQARKVLETLPARLCDALAIDTGVWQAAGWSPLPPVLRKLVYDRPQIGPLPPARRVRRASRDPLACPGEPEAARFVLAGRPRPRVEDTLRIAEVLRVALMAQCPYDRVPAELSGRDAAGPLRKDAAHGHAFYLPEDADRDGRIDHLVVYSRLGFSSIAKRALEQLSHLYISRQAPSAPTPASRSEADDPGRKEWRVALDQLTKPDRIDGSRLLGRSKVWVSATPYLMTRYQDSHAFDFAAQLDRYRQALLREWRARGIGAMEPEIDPVKLPGADRFGVDIGSRRRSPLQFVRTRPRGRGGPQPDAAGSSLRLTFPTETEGPMAFGKHAHLGLGLFRRSP